MGLSFITSAGPRQRNHSQIRVPLDSWHNFSVLYSRLPPPGGPSPCIYITWKRASQLYHQALGSLFVASYDSKSYGIWLLTATPSHEPLLYSLGTDHIENTASNSSSKCGRDSHGTRTREWMRWLGPAAIVNDRPILFSQRMLYKDYDRRCSIEKKNSGRESQGARRQDERLVIGGKPPVVK
jgi:hypothetical protein